MKRYLLVLLFIISIQVFAGSWKKVLQTDIGSLKGQVGILRNEKNQTAPIGFAPTSFAVFKGVIAVADAYNNRINIYKKAKIFQELRLDKGSFVNDIAFGVNGELFALDLKGKQVYIFKLNNKKWQLLKKIALKNIENMERIYYCGKGFLLTGWKENREYDLNGKLINTYSPLTFKNVNGDYVVVLYPDQKTQVWFLKDRPVFQIKYYRYTWPVYLGSKKLILWIYNYKDKKVKQKIFISTKNLKKPVVIKVKQDLMFDTNRYVVYDENTNSLYYQTYNPKKDKYEIFKFSLNAEVKGKK